MRELPPAAARLQWDALRLALVVPRNAIPDGIDGAAGRLALSEHVHGAVLDALARGPSTLSALRASDRLAALGDDTLREALLLLMGAGYVDPCPAIVDDAAAGSTQRLNRAILERARWSGEIRHLASPVTGSGIEVSRHDQLFLLCEWLQEPDPAAFAAAALAAQGVQVVSNGSVLNAAADILDELRLRHARFTGEIRPLMQQLGLLRA